MKTEIESPMKNRLHKRAQRTHNRLKKAALDVFSEKSVDAATIEEITERADLGKGTLYQHFNDKEDIVTTLVDEAIDHLIEKMRLEKHPGRLEDMLEHLINAHYKFYIDSKEEFLLLFQGKLLLKLESDTLDELEQPFLRYLGEIEKLVSGYLSAKTDSKIIRRFACAAAGFSFGFFSFAMIGMSREETERSIKPLRRTFIRGLRTFLGH